MTQETSRPRANPVVTGATGNPAPKPKIISVCILGRDDQEILGKCIQYVNIEKDERYVDEDIGVYLNQLGKYIKCKVKFDQKGVHNFKIKLTPRKTITYTGGEDNDNFKYESNVFDYTTDENGEKIVESLFLSCAGGDTFVVSATYNDKTKHSMEVKTQRLMYYIEARMPGMDTITSTRDFESEYAQHGIKFHKLGSFPITWMENIGNKDDELAFLGNVEKGYSIWEGQKKDPCVVVAYTGHLAVKGSAKRLETKKAKAGVPQKVRINVRHENMKKEYPLWYKIGGEHDTNGWFYKCFFTKEGDSDDKAIPIPEDLCTPKQARGKPAGWYGQVEVDISSLTETPTNLRFAERGK